MVVSVGAERINDNFYKLILFSLDMFSMIQSYQKFLILFPLKHWPFYFKLTRFLSEKILNKCDVIFLRDYRSNEIIKEIAVFRPNYC